jgi:membrane protease YdiL (CAAX protease family)
LTQIAWALAVLVVSQGVARGLGDAADDSSSWATAGRFALTMAAGSAVSVVGFRYLCRRFRGRTPVELGRRGAAKEVGLSLGAGAAVMAAGFGVLGATGVYTPVDPGLCPGVLTGLAVGYGAAVIEEVFFRGVLLHVLVSWSNPAVGVVVVGLLFGGLHATSPDVGWWGAVGIVLSTWVLNLLYVATGRLWAPIGFHAAWNFCLGGVFGSDVSGNGTGRGLFRAQWTGDALWTGGATGAEGSVVLMALGCLAGLAALLWSLRRGTFRRGSLTLP